MGTTRSSGFLCPLSNNSSFCSEVKVVFKQTSITVQANGPLAALTTQVEIYHIVNDGPKTGFYQQNWCFQKRAIRQQK